MDASTTDIPAPLVALLARHAERTAPEEACGVVFGEAGVATEVLEVPNAHAGTPAARCSFELDERALLKLLSAPRARGQRLVAFYHSHVDVPATLSAADVAAALAPGGVPWWPDVEQIVVGVRGGRAVEVRRFAWDGRSFAPVSVGSLPPPHAQGARSS